MESVTKQHQNLFFRDWKNMNDYCIIYLLKYKQQDYFSNYSSYSIYERVLINWCKHVDSSQNDTKVLGLGTETEEEDELGIFLKKIWTQEMKCNHAKEHTLYFHEAYSFVYYVWFFWRKNTPIHFNLFQNYHN